MNTKHLQALQKQLLLFLFLTLAITSCRDDKEQADESMKSETYYEGEVRMVHTGEATVPGLYDCYFTNRNDNSELVVAAIVYSEEGDIVFVPKTPIRTGEYYFNRAVTIKTDRPEDIDLIGEDIALGDKVSFTSTDCIFSSEKKDPLIGCCGTGTEKDPFRISSYIHLMNLMKTVNSTAENNKKYGDKYYLQTANLSLSRPSANLNVGWNSIGNLISRPFSGHYDGDGKVISDMLIRRETGSVAQPAGLFGIVINATIKNVKLEKCRIISDFAVAGMLVGTVVSTGSEMLTSAITDCSVSNSCQLKANYLAGGLVGGVDQFARLIMTNCSNAMPISIDMPGAGGLIGASLLTSTVTLDNCSNTANIQSTKGIVGGLIGSADTLLVNNSWNSGEISSGSSSVGTGGLVGGGTNVVASFCENRGRVTGGREVGGILGSAARSSKEKIYGDARVYASSNSGYITGTSEVGGLVGSAQILISGSYNFNTVTATGKNAGGLAGLGPIAVIIGSVNDGDVICDGADDDSFVGGILGSAQDYTLSACNNFGDVTASDRATVGGILGGCDLLGIISYCGNMGHIQAAKGSVGGIIGRAGKPKNMSDKMIADMVLGTALSVASIGMSGAGISGGGKKGVQLVKLRAQLDLAGAMFGIFTSINDFSWTVANNVMAGSTLTREALQHLEVQTSEALQLKHKNQIATMYWDNGNVSLTAAIAQQQVLQDAFIKRLQAENCPYQDNMDTWRGETEDKMHGKEESRMIASHAGECISFAGDILGFANINPLSIVVSVIVGIYNLVMNLTDYSYNRVGIFQSFNYGKVTTSSGDYFGGGIAGELHDYARLYNSANFGAVEGKKIGMLIGKGGHLPEITNSANIFAQAYNGHGESDVANVSSALSVYYQGLYYSCPFYEKIEYNVIAGLHDARSQSSYTDRGFDFNKCWSWWNVLNLPLIYQSEFE